MWCRLINRNVCRLITTMKEIPGHSGYFITEDGKVYSNHVGNTLRELKPQLTHKGYHKVMFRDKKTYFIHRLVCLTYLPNPDNLPQVNHIDKNKINNHVSNLEWCDNTYNLRYSKARDWKVMTPNGDIIEVHNLTQWCKENGVFQGNMSSRGSSKGYRLV